MKQARKIYDIAFKRKAVQLSNERTNVSELARELGVKATLLYKWRKEFEEFGTGSFPGNGKLKLTVEQQKIYELEKKLKLQQSMENFLIWSFIKWQRVI